jgi:pyruvate dehydrogenase E1 component alpha subunit
MHIADFSVGSLGANGIVGGGIPIAVGAALSQKLRRDPYMTVCFFGDGASNEGSFHEAANLASVWKLPVLFVCVNNQYAMSTPIPKQMAIRDLADRAVSYGMKGVTMDGNDAIAIYRATLEAKEYVKRNGPMLLVLDTYRHMGHSKSDANVYRTKEEIEEWKKRDPIPRMRRALLDAKTFTAAELDAMEAQAKKDVEAAVRFAEESPDPKVENVQDDVYAPVAADGR